MACSSMDKFKNTDECSRNSINRMGFKASSSPHGTFYLSTQDADQFPYCQHLYSVTLSVGNDNVQTTGRIQISLQGSNHQPSSFVFDQHSSLLLKANDEITRIFSLDQFVSDITAVSIDLKVASNGIYQPFRQVTVTDIERQKSFTLCPKDNNNLRFELC